MLFQTELVLYLFGAVSCVLVLAIETEKPPKRTLELLQAAVSGGRPENPGATLSVNEPGVNYGFNLAGIILNNEIMNLQIPDIYDKFSDGFINISSVRITAYNPPQFVRQFEPPQTLTWGLKGAGVNVQGSWKGSKKVALQVTGEGTFTAKARQLEVNISVDISNTPDGRPILLNIKCKSNLKQIRIYLKGGLTGYIINVFRNLLIHAVTPLLETEVCNLARNFVQSDINKILASFPPKLNVVKGVDLHLALFTPPQLTFNTIELNHSGRAECLSSNTTPFYPRVLNKAFNRSTEKMVSLYLTDYVVNSLLYHIQLSNYLNVEIDPGQFGRVSCSIVKGQICLGAIFSDMSKIYSSNSLVHILINATKNPFVFFVPDLAILYGEVEITLKVFTPNGSINESETFLNIHARMVAEIRHAIIINSTLFSNLTITSLTMDLTDSDKIAPDLWSAFVTFLRPFLQNILNNILTNGFHLHLNDEVKFYNGRVQFYNRTMLIESDVEYFHKLKPNFIKSDTANGLLANVLLLSVCTFVAIVKSSC